MHRSMTGTKTRLAGFAEAAFSGIVMRAKSTSGIVFLAALLSGFIFVIDFIIPLGVAAGVPYVAVMLLGIWLLQPGHVVGLAVATSLLIVLGYLMSPTGGIAWMVLANRALALFAIWVVALAIVRRKREEAVLGESQESYRVMVDAAPDAVLILTNDRIVYANAAAAGLFGATSAGQLVGRSVEDFVHPDYREVSAAGRQRLLEDRKTTRRFEQKALKLDGSTIDIEIIASYLRWSGADSIQPILRDISERKRSERDLVGRHVELEALVEERARDFRVVADNIPVLIAQLDAEQRWLFANRTAEQWLDRNLDEILGKTIGEVMGGDFHETISAHLEAVLAGEPQRFEAALTYPDGVTRDVDLTYLPDFAPTGAVRGFFSVALDISERKRVEEALRESEEKYRSIFENAEVGLTQARISDGTVIEANQRAADVLGYRDANQLKREFVPERHWADLSQREGMLAEIMAKGSVGDREIEIIRRDGSRGWGRISVVSFPERDYLVAVALDISERKLAEEALRESERQLSEAQRIGKIGHFRTVLNSPKPEWSDQVYRLFGYSPEEIEPSAEFALSIMHSDDRDRYLEVRDAAVANKSEYSIEYRVIKKDGDEIFVAVNSRPEFDDAGEVVALYGTIQDITERKQVEELLRQSEERFRDVLEVVEEVVWETNLEGQYTFLSKSSLDAFGVDHDQAIGMKPADFVAEDERAAIVAFFRDVITKRRKFTDFQYRITTPKGRRIWISGSGAPLYSSTGEIVGYRGTAHDVTAKRLAEEALRRSEESYRSIFDNAQVGIIRSRISDGKPLEANDRLAEILGYENREDAINNHRADNHWIDPVDRELWIAEGLKYGFVRNFDGRLKRKDGSIVHISSSATFNTEQDYIDVVMVDQSDRVEAEARRKASETTLSGMLEIAPDAIIATGEDLLISIFNQGAENVFGWQESEVLGQHLDILIPEKLRGPHRQQVKSFLASVDQSHAMSERGEIVGLRKDGSEFPAQASISKLRLGDDTMLTVILHDITERKQGEAELVAAKETAEYADRAKSEFLANMSHELRTPLNAIMGFAQMIKSQSLGAQAVERYLDYADNIFDSGGHLLAIIDDILDLSKVDAGKVELDEREFDLTGTIEACETLIMGRANIADVSMVIGGKTSGLRLFADERLVKQMLLNLLSNAVKFTHPGGRLTLTVQGAEDGRLAISVADTGIGMVAKDIAIALSPFGQIESAMTRGHEGTGLGLPIVVALAELHGCELELQSEPGVGTKATVWFPKERIVYAG